MSDKKIPLVDRSPVKKNMDKLHKPVTHKDRKKEAKKDGFFKIDYGRKK